MGKTRKKGLERLSDEELLEQFFWLVDGIKLKMRRHWGKRRE